MALDLFIIGVLLLLSAFFSGSETALMAADRIKLRQRSREDKRAKTARMILKQPEKLLATLLFCNNLVNVGLSAMGTALAIRIMGSEGVWVATALVTIFLLVFSEITPKTLAAYYPTQVAVAVAGIMHACVRVFYPVVQVLTWISTGIIRLMGVSKPEGRPHITEEELAFVIKASAEEGVLGHEKQEMLMGVLSLDQVLVGDIMIPLRDVVCLSLDATYEEVFETLRTYKYARYPVYQGDRANIVGFIHARDFFLEASPERFHLKRLLRPPHYVPELRTIGQQLMSFKEEQAHLSMVVDEYGNVVGIVTMEDVLEEIVGEIEDEHDPEIHWVQNVGPGVYSVDGRVTLRDLNRWLRIDVPMKGVRTISGLVQRELGRIPREGDEVVVGSYRIKVKEMRGRSVVRLELHLPRES